MPLKKEMEINKCTLSTIICAQVRHGCVVTRMTFPDWLSYWERVAAEVVRSLEDVASHSHSVCAFEARRLELCRVVADNLASVRVIFRVLANIILFYNTVLWDTNCENITVTIKTMTCVCVCMCAEF
jgi:hypothetical protein